MANNLLSGIANWGGLLGAPSVSDIGGLFGNQPQPNYPPAVLMNQIPGSPRQDLGFVVEREVPQRPATTYESLERFIPPELRGFIPSWPRAFRSPEQTALLGAQTFGPQADLAAGLTSWNNAWRGLLDSEQPLSKRLQDFGVGSAYTAAALPMMFLPGTIAWHGTPHRWAPEPGYPHGRPRLDKIGTGEGPQMYGRGHYSGGAKGTGEQYRADLAYKHGKRDMAEGLFSQKQGDVDAAIESLKREMAQYDAKGWPREGYRAPYDEALKKLEGWKTNPPKHPGHLYKYDIPDADTAKFLDYDAPLDAQPQAVKDAIKKAGFWPNEFVDPNRTTKVRMDRVAGGDIFHNMQEELGKEGAAAAMRDAGVPGLRFKDQLSRRLGGPAGSMGDIRIGSKTGTDYGVNYWEELHDLVSRSRNSLEESQGPILKVIRERRKRWDDLSIDPAYQHRDYARDQAEKWLAMEMDAKNKGVAFGDPDITHNYVTWDQDVLNRTKILEIDDLPVSGAKIETSRRGNVLEISKIEVPKDLRGQGLAGRELQNLINKADSEGLVLALTPSDAFGASKSRLEKWYRRHGFVRNTGRNKNFATRESYIRQPKTIELNDQPVGLLGN